MKIVLSIRILAAIYCLLHAAFSHADLKGTLTLTTDNIDRWFSKSNHGPAVQANLDYQFANGMFLGSSVSTLHYVNAEQSSSAQVEMIPYLGWSFKLNELWRLDTQWSRYVYDGSIFGRHQVDYDEYYVLLHFKDRLSARLSISDDYYGLGNYALDYEITGRYPLMNALELSAGVGYSQTTAVLGSDYAYWNIGLTYYYRIFALDLRYRDALETNIDSSLAGTMHTHYDPPLINTAFVFSLSIGF